MKLIVKAGNADSGKSVENIGGNYLSDNHLSGNYLEDMATVRKIQGCEDVLAVLNRHNPNDNLIGWITEHYGLCEIWDEVYGNNGQWYKENKPWLDQIAMLKCESVVRFYRMLAERFTIFPGKWENDHSLHILRLKDGPYYKYSAGLLEYLMKRFVQGEIELKQFKEYAQSISFYVYDIAGVGYNVGVNSSIILKDSPSRLEELLEPEEFFKYVKEHPDFVDKAIAHEKRFMGYMRNIV